MTLSTSFQNLNGKISADRQQESLVHLGQLALSNITLPDLMTRAAALIAHALGAEILLIWELDEDRNSIALKASMGWNQESVEKTRRPLESNSLENFTLISQCPILIENLPKETRFQAADSLLERGIVSGISIPIGTAETPLGVIDVFAREAKAFSSEDFFFLQNAANILGLAIARNRVKGPFVTSSAHLERDKQEIKNRLIESRERERLRLAQELHDAPIQDLYGFIYQLDDLKDILKGTEAEKIVDDYNQSLQRIVNNLRTICRELRPPSLSPFGLEVAIRDHVEKLHDENPKINIHLALMRDKQILSDSLRLSLFRIYQQAISNVMRHAEATEVHVRFRWDENMIILEVEDNGKGFRIPKSWMELVRNDHFGLIGLAERVESIHGNLEIISAPGDGTLVRAIVPRH